MSLGVGDKALDNETFKMVLKAQVELLQNEAQNLDEIKQYIVYFSSWKDFLNGKFHIDSWRRSCPHYSKQS